MVMVIEVLAFLVGHIAGYGEGSENLGMDELLPAALASGVFATLLSAVLGLATIGGYLNLDFIFIAATGVADVAMGSLLSGFIAVVGTYIGYGQEVVSEDLVEAFY